MFFCFFLYIYSYYYSSCFPYFFFFCTYIFVPYFFYREMLCIAWHAVYIVLLSFILLLLLPFIHFYMYINILPFIKEASSMIILYIHWCFNIIYPLFSIYIYSWMLLCVRVLYMWDVDNVRGPYRHFSFPSASFPIYKYIVYYVLYIAHRSEERTVFFIRTDNRLQMHGGITRTISSSTSKSLNN